MLLQILGGTVKDPTYLATQLKASTLCTVAKLVIRRGDQHGLDGAAAETQAAGSKGYGWAPVNPLRIREELFSWALECHATLDNDCEPQKARGSLVLLLRALISQHPAPRPCATQPSARARS